MAIDPDTIGMNPNDHLSIQERLRRRSMWFGQSLWEACAFAGRVAEQFELGVASEQVVALYRSCDGCHGVKGGVVGNSQWVWVDGVERLLCDYCHAEAMERRDRGEARIDPPARSMLDAIKTVGDTVLAGLGRANAEVVIDEAKPVAVLAAANRVTGPITVADLDQAVAERRRYSNDMHEWLRYGIDRGWCSPPVCSTHDGIPTTLEEDEADEPCVFVIRCYRDDDHRGEVEANSPAAVQRKQEWR